MDTTCCHMNTTLRGENLHPDVILHPGANLHTVANCADENDLIGGSDQITTICLSADNHGLTQNRLALRLYLAWTSSSNMRSL